MPTGTIRIKEENGQQQVWLERGGSSPLHLTGMKPDDKLVDGISCAYQKTGKQLLLDVGGKKYNWSAQTQTPNVPPASQKEPRMSTASLLRDSEKRQDNYTSEPELEEVGQCAKPKKLTGNNLYDFNTQALRLPEDTAGHIRWLKKEGADNFALALNKAVHFYRNKEGLKPLLFRQDRNEHFYIKGSFSKLLVSGILERQNSMICQLQGENLEIKDRSLPIQNRLIHGLGNSSVFETSMTLHHVYGIPYLPASSIKGVVRSWVIRNCFWMEEEDEKKRSKASEENAMRDPLFTYIFGKDVSGDKQAQQGKVVFFDAYPQSPPVIEPDIMNVHYPKYYGGTGLPVDYDSPNPIPFLTVGKCDANGKPLLFKFYVACKERDVKPEITGNMIDKSGDKLPSQSTILDVVGFWLTSALSSHGIGAKTAVGYGYMKSV